MLIELSYQPLLIIGISQLEFLLKVILFTSIIIDDEPIIFRVRIHSILILIHLQLCHKQLSIVVNSGLLVRLICLIANLSLRLLYDNIDGASTQM